MNRCEYCHQPFTATDADDPRYCSLACENDAIREQYGSGEESVAVDPEGEE